MRKFVLYLAIALLLSGCIEFNQPYQIIAPGKWRAEMPLIPKLATKERRDAALSTKSELTEGKLPFIFEVFNPTEDSVYIEIINGVERIPVTDIQFGRRSTDAHDTIHIEFPIYDTYIDADVDGGRMDGFWSVRSKKDYKIPFSARYGQAHRFTTLKKKPVMDVSGLWSTIFDEGNDAFDAVGSFEQKGNHLSGTFMTETGDFRFLEGTIQADKIYLSAFDGSHAFLFEAKINAEDKTMMGSFRSGTHYKTTWSARQDANAHLISPDSLVKLKVDAAKVAFSLPTSDGGQLSLDDPSLAGKPVILTIMGTWCPNCRDEGAFLAEYIKAHPTLPVKIIGLAFEKHDDASKNATLINKYKQKGKIPYDILLAGKPQKANVLSLLPQMENFVAYPTMIFLNKDHQIIKTHTGFNGPATPEYVHFRKDFEETILKMQK